MGKASILSLKQIEQIKAYLKTDKGRRLIIIIGIAGMALILLSSILPRQPSNETATEQQQMVNNSQYEQLLEQRLIKLISEIDGAGKTNVLVTLENGEENIYAVNKEDSQDISEKWTEDGQKNQDNSKENRQDIVIIKQDGNEQPVITTTIEPRVKGVVVVCQGGGIATIKSKISQAVTTALNISSDRVCVIQSD